MPTVPIVFVTIYEPVEQGLAHPGGNATGFTMPPATIGGKWLELLPEMAPALTRVISMCNPSNPGPLQPYASVQGATHNHAVKVALAAVHSAAEIETAMTTWAREPGGGLILPPGDFLLKHNKLIIELAAREKLPAIHGLHVSRCRAAWPRMASSCRSKTARLGCTSAGFCVERNRGSAGAAAVPIRIGH